MKETIKITSVLTTVCLICAFLLAFVYSRVHKKIAFNEVRRVEEAIISLVPQAEDIRKTLIEDELIYELFDNQGTLIAYAFLVQGQGYQGKIKLLVAADISLERLRGIEVVESLETPGLGAKIQENPFKGQFTGLPIKHDIICRKGEVKGDSEIQAITGATVSSQALVNILNKRIKQIRELINK